jgi:hypothetical protein
MFYNINICLYKNKEEMANKNKKIKKTKGTISTKK